MSSLPAIRVALETKLATVTGPDYAWENTPYTPTTGTPFAQPFLLPAEPANLEMGPGYTEQGIFQVNGFFPKDSGAEAATAWAEQVRAAFPISSSISSGGVTVNIPATPYVGQTRPDVAPDRTMIPVKVRWLARINGG